MMKLYVHIDLMEPVSRNVMEKTDMEISVLDVSCFLLTLMFIMHKCLTENITDTKSIKTKP